MSSNIINRNDIAEKDLTDIITSAKSDILSRSNGAYNAKVGYDNCTSRGSINGVSFKSLINPFVNRSYIRKVPHAADTTSFTVSNYVSIYNIPPPSGKPYVVAVPSFGGGLFGTATPDPNDPTVIKITNGDGQKYWTHTLNIPLANHPLVLIKLMPGSTNNPSTPNKATDENTLDVTTVGGACPSSALTIILYIAPTDTTSNYDMYNFIYTTPVVANGVTYRPDVIASSWGNSESLTDQEDMNMTNKLFQTITAAGVNVISASGDYLAQNGGTGLNVDFPSSSPYATTVGGTTLTSPNDTYDSETVETVWNTTNPNQGTGGGISTKFSKPSYQNITALSGTTYRSIPDLALVANPSDGIILYINGSISGNSTGGTSMSSPLFAAFLACINCKKWVNPILYSAATSSNYLTYYHDITVGNNCPGGVYNPQTGYNSAVGYDSCTGWGSINGSTLQYLLSNIPCTSLTVSPTPVSVQISQTVQLVSTITPSNATNKTLTYTSSNPNIATVSNTGLVTGVAAGTTSVVVRTTDGSNLSVTVPVTVTSSNVLCTSLTVDPEYQDILGTKQLYPLITPENATNKILTYTSSNLLIATVSNTGLVTGVKQGFADIIVTTTDGSNLSFTVKLTVTQIDCTGLTVSPTSVTLEKTKTVQLVSDVTPFEATDKTLSYTSSNPLIATVSNTGLITGVAVGATSVIVRTTDGSNLSVTVPVTVISEPICVVRGTRIMMADGTSKPIQDIQRGDRVLCDKESGVFQKVARLTEMMHNGKAIQIPRGLIGNKKKLIMTPEHPIWIKNENRMYSKHIKGAIPLTISEKVYNIQFEEEGTYYAEGIKVDSMSPNFYQMKLPKDLFFNRLKHNKRLFVQEEDDPVRRKPKMIQI